MKSILSYLLHISDGKVGKGSDIEKLQIFFEKNNIEQDLAVNYNSFFELLVFKQFTTNGQTNAEIDLVAIADNDGLQKFCEHKKFARRSFEIPRNGRRHYIQLSVEENGHFFSLHNSMFLNNMILFLDPTLVYVNEGDFNSESESIHYLYKLDDDISDEIMILSFQTTLLNT